MLKLVANFINAIELVIGKIATILTAFLAGGFAMIIFMVWREMQTPGFINQAFTVSIHGEEKEKKEEEKPKKARTSTRARKATK